MYHANSNQNRDEVAVLIPDKTELKTKMTRNEVRSYIMIIGSINQDLTITHTYSPNNRAPNIWSNSDRTEGRSRQLGSNSWSLTAPFQLDIRSTRKEKAWITW